jgi:hypothetical protein
VYSECTIGWTTEELWLGRAIAQAVSRWLPTAAAWVRTRVWSCEICGGQSGAGAGFIRVLRLPLPIFIPPIAPQWPSSIIWGLYNRPEVAAVPSGLSPTPLRKKTVARFWAVSRNLFLFCPVVGAHVVSYLLDIGGDARANFSFRNVVFFSV